MLASPHKPRSEQSIGTAELVTAMVLSGTLGVFVVESGASPYTVVFFRCLFGALALGAYCWLRGYLRDSGFTPKTLAMAAVGGFFIVFNWAFLFQSYETTSISLATIIYHTQPFYVVLVGSLVFRERLTLAKVGWVLVAFGGLVLVTGLTNLNTRGPDDYLIGVGYALLAAAFYGTATLIAKKLDRVRPHMIALVQVLLGVPMLLPFARFDELSGLGADWGWLIGLGVIHTCIQYILLYSSYHKLPTASIAVLSFVYPAVAVVVDMMVYGTRMSLLQVLGVALVVTASLGVRLGWRFPRTPTDPRQSDAPAASDPPEPQPEATNASRNDKIGSTR